MQRRNFLVVGASIALTGIAGCLSDSNESYAENAVESIDDELGVDEWNADDGSFHVWYFASGNPGHDIIVVGGSYAGAVDAGLDARCYAYGVDDAGDEVLRFDVEPEWAQAFMDDEIDEDEYLDRIEATIR